MRISDLSSDVCSSDLDVDVHGGAGGDPTDVDLGGGVGDLVDPGEAGCHRGTGQRAVAHVAAHVIGLDGPVGGVELEAGVGAAVVVDEGGDLLHRGAVDPEGDLAGDPLGHDRRSGGGQRGSDTGEIGRAPGGEKG